MKRAAYQNGTAGKKKQADDVGMNDGGAEATNSILYRRTNTSLVSDQRRNASDAENLQAAGAPSQTPLRQSINHSINQSINHDF